MAGTTSSIISNLLKKLSQFVPPFTSFAASSSSSIAQEDVTAANVNSDQESLMEDLRRLWRMLRRIQAALLDAEEREIYDKAIQLWLSELREVAYDAEDVLDQYDYQVIKVQEEGMIATTEADHSLKRKRDDDDDDDDDDDIHGYQESIPSLPLIKIPIPCNIAKSVAKRIIKIIDKFDEIAKDREALQLPEDAPRRSYLDDAMKMPPTSSFVNDSDIFGRDDDKKKIIQLLMSHSKKENIVIPIVGMGGVGKTTLAQLIYHDPVVCQHFSPKVWVCISKEFDIMRITKEIVSSIIKSSIHDDKKNLNDLQCILKEALLDKRYLLILDDVWNERANMWEALIAPFSSIGIGNIIVTTRSMSVARIMQTVPPHKLGCLDDDKSWLLFQRHAFNGWEVDQKQTFEQIGRGITKKCDGLPLALKTIGGFLRNEVEEHIWKNVLNNNLWELEETEIPILPSLRISYNYLPVDLRPCFLFASLFPKDYNFSKVELIRMWIAQGYIELRGRNRLLEDIASEYFEDLMKRSLFQCSKYSKTFTLHDMVHDLAQSMARNEIYSSLDFDELNIPENAKHIFIKEAMIDQVLPLGNIRTLYICTLHSKIQFCHLGCLRVLTFVAPYFDCSFEFIDLIGGLQQLRYLTIYARVIHMTENSLCCLYKLETLRLVSSNIPMLPHAMRKLINLHHLMIVSNSHKLVPKSYFGSKNLLTINFSDVKNGLVASTYHVRRDGPYSSIRWLRPLTNLQRSLELSGLENVVDNEDAKSANLQSKLYIESLTLKWGYHTCARNDKAILEGLQPHTNLKELTINGYNSSSFPSWFGDPQFSNLTKIELNSLCWNEECKFLPLFKLPSLTSLKIIDSEGITRMEQDFWCYNAPPDWLENYSIEPHMNFRSSEYHRNNNFLEWKGHPMERNGYFTSLKRLFIFKCHKLQQISTLPSSLQIIKVLCCDRLECIALPYILGHLSKLQKVDIFYCINLKSLINLKNILGTLKVLKLVGCYQLKPDSHEDFAHSFGRVLFKEGFPRVVECPGMKKWCQWHGFSYKEDFEDYPFDKEFKNSSSNEESDDSSSDETLKHIRNLRKIKLERMHMRRRMLGFNISNDETSSI